MAKVADPIERVFETLNYYRNNLINSQFACGCLLGKLALEIRETQPHIHQRIAIGFDTWTTAVAKCLEEAREDLPTEIDFKTLSPFILAMVRGAVVQARAHLSIAPFDTAVQHLGLHFDLLLALRDGENKQSELHQAQNAKRRTRARNKRNAPLSQVETSETATSFQPSCTI